VSNSAYVALGKKSLTAQEIWKGRRQPKTVSEFVVFVFRMAKV